MGFAPTALKDSIILENLEKLHPQYEIPNATPAKETVCVEPIVILCTE